MLRNEPRDEKAAHNLSTPEASTTLWAGEHGKEEVPESRSWSCSIGSRSIAEAISPSSSHRRDAEAAKADCMRQRLGEKCPDVLFSHPRSPTNASHWLNLIRSQIAGRLRNTACRRARMDLWANRT